jgi:hypothetical protein
VQKILYSDEFNYLIYGLTKVTQNATQSGIRFNTFSVDSTLITNGWIGAIQG